MLNISMCCMDEGTSVLNCAPRFSLFSRLAVLVIASVGFVLFAANPAAAFVFDTGPNWHVYLNNTPSFTIGTRLEDIDPAIGNNPNFDGGDYKFANKWDIVTSRLADLLEFGASYKGSVGVRLSMSAFTDLAYDDHVHHHPGNVAPGVKYSDLTTYKDDVYSPTTRKDYVQGFDILDAFVFYNGRLGGHTYSLKVGQMVQYWGASLFFNRMSIAYSQNATNFVKQVGAPGLGAKEYAIPRGQIDAQFSVTPFLVVEFQQMLESDHDKLIQGGTFLGGGDAVYSGPDFINGGAITRGDIHGNSDWGFSDSDFGVRVSWAPLWLRGKVGFYYRHFDEVEPWAVLYRPANPPSPTGLEYFQSYAQDVNLYGISINRAVGATTVGFEVSYREDSALPTVADPGNPTETGATGNTLFAIANVIVPLSSTPFWDTAIVLAELGYSHLFRVTSNNALYNSVNNPKTCPTGDVGYGCSTKNHWGLAVSFAPTWLQVLPGVNISMPLFAEYGLHGNAPALGIFTRKKGIFYTLGLSANIHNKTTIALTFHGVHYPLHGRTTFRNLGGPAYAAGGNGFYFYNDKDWLSLTFKTQF